MHGEVVDGWLQPRLLCIHQYAHALLPRTLEAAQSGRHNHAVIYSVPQERDPVNKAVSPQCQQLTSAMSSSLLTSPVSCSFSRSENGVTPNPPACSSKGHKVVRGAASHTDQERTLTWQTSCNLSTFSGTLTCDSHSVASARLLQ